MSSSSQPPGKSNCDEHQEQPNAEVQQAPSAEASGPEEGNERGQRFAPQDWINASIFLLGSIGIFGFLILMFSIHLLTRWVDTPAVINGVALSGTVIALAAGILWVIVAFALIVTMVTQSIRSRGTPNGKDRPQT